jgi:hypothetical protein
VVTPYGYGRAKQPADAKAEPGPGLAQDLGQTVPGPRHELTPLSAAQHPIVLNSNLTGPTVCRRNAFRSSVTAMIDSATAAQRSH